MKPNVLGIILAVAVAVLACGYGIYSYFAGGDESADSLTRQERLALKKNIMVLGIDERPKDDDPGRSDTIFVVMFDTQKKTVSLLSIPRDTRVRIPGNGFDKINHAFSYGSRQLTQETVEEFLGIRIDNYVQVDFNGFKGVVDAIGGVDIDVEEDMYYYDDWDDFLIDIKKGPQHLDGEKAIQYVRYRDEEGDIGRIKRQQHFLMAVYDKIASAFMLLRFPGLSRQITSMIDTNLPMVDMVDIGRALLAMVKEKGISAATVPGTPEDIGDINYWIPDIAKLRAEMAKMQGAEMTDRYRSAAEMMEAEYGRSFRHAVAEEKEEKAASSSGASLKKELQSDSVKKCDAERVEGRKKKQKEQKKQESKKQEPKNVKQDNDNKGNKHGKAPAAPALAAAPAPAAAPARPSRTTLLLINRSGSTADGAAARQRLENAGFAVLDGGSDAMENETLVISTTNDGSIVAKLAKIPFPHKTRTDKDPSASYDGIVILGRDFR